VGAKKKTVSMTCGKLTVEVPHFVSTGDEHPAYVDISGEDLAALACLLVVGDVLTEPTTVDLLAARELFSNTAEQVEVLRAIAQVKLKSDTPADKPTKRNFLEELEGRK
jgi:hypothetical protein